MAGAIHTRPNMMTEARNTQGERQERIVDILVSPDSESLRDQHQDHVGTEESSPSLRRVRSQQPDAVNPPWCSSRAVVVILGLLSVILLVRLLGLAVQCKEKTVSMERDMEQALQRIKILTEGREALLCPQGCPGDWVNFGCKCYHFNHSSSQSWKKSRMSCVASGADLVVINTKEELDFIRNHTQRLDYWLGATDKVNEGMWRWVDETVLLVDNPFWSRGQPDGGIDQNCLELKSYFEQKQYGWSASCKAKNFLICETILINFKYNPG